MLKFDAVLLDRDGVPADCEPITNGRLRSAGAIATCMEMRTLGELQQV